MNIVQIHSGLGNQMFQYAFYLALKHNEPQTKIDTSVFRHRPSHNGYELERLFAIQPDHASIAERNRMADIGKDWFSVMRRALGWKRNTIGQLIQEPDPAQGWCPELLHAQNSYMQGYWQSENYFLPIADEIRAAFQFRIPLKETDKDLAARMAATQSVSVHIRRGDYLKARRKEDYDVCSVSYYRRAVEYIKAHVPSPVFYVFSDEPQWGKEQRIFPADTIFISGHTGQNAYIDMQLMSLCRHHIIANSSFSWWGAWLGQTKSSVVIAPNTWFRFRKRPDIVPLNWIRIDVD